MLKWPLLGVLGGVRRAMALGDRTGKSIPKLGAIMALLLLAACGDSSARPGLFSSSSVNFTYAVSNICLPYVNGAQDDAIVRGWGVARTGWGRQGIFQSQGMAAHLVGVAGRINVGVKAAEGRRLCIVEVNQGDPLSYHSLLLSVMKSWPNFEMSSNPPAAGDWAHRDMFCAAQPSTTFLLASTNQPGTPGPRMLISVIAGPMREPRCG